MELQEENWDAARIYQITRGQIVTLGDQAVDISHAAVWQAIDRTGVRDTQRCFNQVIHVFHYMLARAREQRETIRAFGE